MILPNLVVVGRVKRTRADAPTPEGCAGAGMLDAPFDC